MIIIFLYDNIKKNRGGIKNPLWKKLIDKGINKTTFANQCGLSKSTLAKMGKNLYIDMSTLDKICTYFNCPINEIIEFTPNSNNFLM